MTLSFGQKREGFIEYFYVALFSLSVLETLKHPVYTKRAGVRKEKKHFCHIFLYIGYNMFVRTPLHIYLKLLQKFNKRYFTLSFRYYIKLFFKSYMQVFQYFENMYI